MGFNPQPWIMGCRWVGFVLAFFWLALGTLALWDPFLDYNNKAKSLTFRRFRVQGLGFSRFRS